jgi:predicted nucleic acid-binding protein
MELYAGARSRKEENEIEAVLANMKDLPVNREIAARAGVFLKHFARSHNVDAPDALIAATAEHFEMDLVTFNLKHFPMLKGARRPW